jgi:hypothetical protein
MQLIHSDKRRFAAACLFASGLCLSLSGMALAGDWKLTDSVRAQLDLVNRSNGDSSSGVVASLSPRISLNGRGGRVTANVNYQLTAAVGTRDTDPRALSHNLAARGRLEAVDNRLFIGATAAARLTGRTATSGPVDPINFGFDGVQTYSFGLQPEYSQPLGRHAHFVSRNSVDYVTYSGGDGAGGSGSGSVLIHAGLRSGRPTAQLGGYGDDALGYIPREGRSVGSATRRLSWNLDASQRRTEFDSRNDENTAVVAGVQYRIDRAWSVNGAVGYEKNDVETNRVDTDGVTWSVGTAWSPNPRTSLTARYGKRYFGDVVSADLRHRTKRTSLSLGLSRDITNRRNFELVDSFFFLADREGNLIVDPTTGNPLIVNIPQLEQTDEDFINNQLRASVAVSGRRTTVTVTGRLSKREYEVSGADESSLDLTVSASRRLGANVNAGAAVDYTRADRTNTGDSETYGIRLSLSRRLTARTRAAIDVLHRQQDVTSGDGYTENRIGVSLTSSFL